MGKRGVILIGMAGGLLWTGLLVLSGPFWPDPGGLWQSLVFAGACTGLTLLAMVGRLAQRRFFDDAIIDGQEPPPGSGADIDRRVLGNTVEQVMLAICLWPLVGTMLGSGTVCALGAGFAMTRILFWIGYHLSPPLRGFGFAAGFYPTVLAVALSLWKGLM